MLKKRVQAFTIDMFVIILTNYALITSFTQFLKTIFFHLPTRSQLFLISKFNMMNSISLLSIMFAYFSLFYFVTNGKTFGKMLVGLRVVSPKGEITLVEAMKRSISHIFCAMTGSILFALPFMRKDDKSLADLFSKTYVISDSDKIKLLVQPESSKEDVAIEEKKAA
jgi:uncharacterized RDD family membrane protein YckC